MLRTAFRSRLPGQHHAAWWELYLHELFVRMGYEIDVHPALPDSSKRPDFLLRRNGAQFYLEAVVVSSGVVTSGRRSAPPWMLDAVNHAANPNFFVRLVEVAKRGEHQLKRKEIVDPLESWLDSEDPDEAAESLERGDNLPMETIRCRGWEIVFEAWPKKKKAREKPRRRLLGIGPMQAGGVNDIEQLRSTLKGKAGRYGRPAIPFVIAVQCRSAFVEPLDIEQALFGSEAFDVPVNGKSQARLYRQRNGFWVSTAGPQNQRISAVLTAVGLHPANVGKAAPCVWVNPWANHPLEMSWPFSSFTATDEGQILHQDTAPDMLFDLPADWPGGDPFPRD